MNLYSASALLGAIVFELLGVSFLQASHQFSRPFYSMATILTHALAIYLLSIALKTIPVGIAYAIWCGVGIAVISGIGLAVFKQKMDFPAVLGILLISLGSILITGFSQSYPR